MITALTFNMQNGEPWQGEDVWTAPPDIAGTIAFLREHPADFVFLQEVEQGFDGGRRVEPPPHFTALQKALPELSAVFSYPPENSDELPFGIGLALFSRWPILGTRTETLPAADCAFPFEGRMRQPSERSLMVAEAETPGGVITLMNTHLQAYFMIGSSSDSHRGQRDAVEAALRRCSGPTLLAGDFNCTPQESLLTQFEGVGFASVQTQEVTWRRRPYVTDHIFHNAPLRPVAWKVIPTPTSDHHAVAATFNLLP